MTFLRALLKDFIQFYFVPFVAAILPWRMARRWLWWWANLRRGPFNEAARPATAIAPEFLPIDDREKFAASCRFVWLIDACDLFLSLTRWRRNWWPWHIEQAGAWPTTRPFIAASFHHGTRHWVFRSLARSGRRSMFVSARFDRSDFRKMPLRYWYGKLRGWDLERLGRTRMAVRPDVSEKLSNALANDVSIVALMDVPPRLAPRGQHHVRLLDQDVSLPDGLLKIAQNAGVPIVPYWIEFDLPRGTRRFCIGDALDPNDVPHTLQTLADILDRQIRRTPEAWFFWPELRPWIEDAKAIPSDPRRAS